MPWKNLIEVKPHDYVCGYCGKTVAVDRGYTGTVPSSEVFQISPNEGIIYICPGPRCGKPTFFAFSPDALRHVVMQIPPPPLSERQIKHLPTGVVDLYREARVCLSSGSYTSATMVCRTLLMHIAVEKGAQKNQTFKHYVDYLNENHHCPPSLQKVVDRIRKQGNQANHEIVLRTKSEAFVSFQLLQTLLVNIYEAPNIPTEK